MLHSLRQTAQTYKRIPSGNTSLPNNVGGQGRKTSIAYFSTKRNRNEHIPPARGRKPLPMGEVALRSNDGEGKPVSQKYLHSDKHWLLSERCYRCAFCFTIASLPSQSRSARQGRVAAPSVCFAVACILLAAAPTAPPCFRRWRRSSPLPQRGSLGRSAPCPLYKYTENPVGKGRSAGKTQKNRFPSCKTGQNALFYSHSLTV